jgi:hypothetical protein
MTIRDDDERTLLERIDDLESAIANMQDQVFASELNIDAIGLRTEILIHRYNAEQSAIENNYGKDTHV